MHRELHADSGYSGKVSQGNTSILLCCLRVAAKIRSQIGSKQIQESGFSERENITQQEILKIICNSIVMHLKTVITLWIAISGELRFVN